MNILLVQNMMRSLFFGLVLLGSSVYADAHVAQNDDVMIGFEDDDDMDLPNLEDIRAWEKKNPPSFFKVTGAFISDHVKKNTFMYVVGASALFTLGYCFRNHLKNYKYRYLVGSTIIGGLAVWYAKNQFDRYMNQTKTVSDELLSLDATTRCSDDLEDIELDLVR